MLELSLGLFLVCLLSSLMLFKYNQAKPKKHGMRKHDSFLSVN